MKFVSKDLPRKVSIAIKALRARSFANEESEEEEVFVRPEESILVVIDPQEKLVRALHESERLVKNIFLLIKAAQVFEVPMVATTQYRKGLGDYVKEIREALGDLELLDKIEFSILKNSTIEEKIRGFSRKILILCGAETHICVYQSALSALEAGYQVVVVGDATSSRSPDHVSYGLSRMRDLGIPVVSTEMLIYEWLGKAGTPAFKALLPYFKN